MNMCPTCNTTFSKAANLKRHLKNVHRIQAAVVPRKGKTTLVIIMYLIHEFQQSMEYKQNKKNETLKDI